MRNFVVIFVVISSFFLFIACGKGGPTHSSGGNQISPVLAEIEEYSPPDDVDAGIFEMLRDEFLRQLGANPERTSASAPMGEAGKVTDLAYNPESGLLRWTYVNLGDYNLSGDVSIADVAEIARYYLADSTDGIGDDPYESWVDGSGDGEVNIADVALIATNYLNEVREYVIRTSDTTDGTFDEIDRVAFSEAKVPPLPGAVYPKYFEVALPAGALSYITVQPADSMDIPGEESDSFGMPPPDDSPIIESVSPTSGFAGAVVNFTAEVSGMLPLTYAWDFGGGADPNTSDEESPKVLLGGVGEYASSLTVTNEFGEDTFEFTLILKDPYIGAVFDSIFLLTDKDTYQVGETCWLTAYAFDNANPFANLDTVRILVDKTRAEALDEGTFYLLDLGDFFTSYDGGLISALSPQQPTFIEFAVVWGGGTTERQNHSGSLASIRFKMPVAGEVTFDIIDDDGSEFGRTYYTDRESPPNKHHFSTLGKDYGEGITSKITVTVE